MGPVGDLGDRGVGTSMAVRPADLPDAMRRIVVERFFGPSPPEGMRLVFHPDLAIQAAIVHEHWQFLRAFPRWVGAVMHGTPHLDVIEYQVENLYGEMVHDPMAANGHYALVLEAGVEAGLTREEILEGTPHPALARALDDWYAIARDRPWFETMAAVHGTEMLADQKLKEIPGYSLPYQMGDAAFLDRSGLTEKGRRFLATTRADTEHAGRAADLVAKYATGPGEPESVLATFRRSMDNMGLYMDALVARTAEYPGPVRGPPMSAPCALCGATWGGHRRTVQGETLDFCCGSCGDFYELAIVEVRTATGWPRVDRLFIEEIDGVDGTGWAVYRSGSRRLRCLGPPGRIQGDPFRAANIRPPSGAVLSPGPRVIPLRGPSSVGRGINRGTLPSSSSAAPRTRAP